MDQGYLKTKEEMASSQQAQAHDAGVGQILSDAWQALLYSGAQTPVDGLTQVVDHFAGTHLEQQAQFVHAPKAAAFGSLDWQAQQIGGALGVAVPFFLINKGVGSVLGGSADTAETIGLRAMARPVEQAALSGAIYQGLLTPTNDGNFFLGRGKNALTGAATFGTLTAGGEALKAAGLNNRMATGALSGIPAGMVGTELNSSLNGKGPASLEQLVQGAGSYAFVGGILGALPRTEVSSVSDARAVERAGSAAGDGKDGREFSVVNGRESLQAFRLGKAPTAWLDVRELFSNGKQGPRRTLLVQHNEGNGLAPQSAQADLLAFCDAQDAGALGARHVFPDSRGKVWMSTDGGASRVSFNTGERPSEAAVALGAEGDNVSLSKFLRDNQLGELMDAVPKRYRQLPVSGEYWHGNDSHVFGLESGDGVPDAVLKITMDNWEPEWGKRPFDARILNPDGSVDQQGRAIFEGEAGGRSAYTYLQERLDMSSQAQVDGGKLAQQMGQAGYEMTDPGSGAGTGWSRLSNSVVVADYNSATARGSNANRTLQEITYGSDWVDEQNDREARDGEQEDPYSEGFSGLDADVKARQAGFLGRMKMNAQESQAAQKLFGANLHATLKDILSQIFDGMWTKKDIVDLQTYVNDSKGSPAARKLAQQQVEFAYKLAKDNNLLER